MILQKLFQYPAWGPHHVFLELLPLSRAQIWLNDYPRHPADIFWMETALWIILIPPSCLFPVQLLLCQLMSLFSVTPVLSQSHAFHAGFLVFIERAFCYGSMSHIWTLLLYTHATRTFERLFELNYSLKTETRTSPSVSFIKPNINI